MWRDSIIVHVHQRRFYVLYVDFQEVLNDSPVHLNMFNSMKNKGVCGKLFLILVSMYSSIKVMFDLMVKLHNHLTVM